MFISRLQIGGKHGQTKYPLQSNKEIKLNQHIVCCPYLLIKNPGAVGLLYCLRPNFATMFSSL